MRNRNICSAQKMWPVTIDLKRDELLYDIKSMAYMEGETLQNQSGEMKSHVQDICEEGNIDRVNRMLDMAHAECLEMLYSYTKKPIEPITWQNNEPKSDCCRVYSIEMHMPEAMSRTTVTLLKNCVHDYMVDYVLADWLKITNAAASAKWASRCEEMKEKIGEAVNFRVGRVRRRQTPF
ncbi:MAG: hypothetical protein MJZ12_01380 [Prevotella sp.]|nr:hypothetical protein [Prevotella sp.]